MKRTRYVKLATFTASDMGTVEKKLNGIADNIKNAGGVIVSIVPHNFGLSPMYLIYNIIYEHDHALTDEELAQAQNEIGA